MEPMIDLVMDLCALCAVQLGFGALRIRRLLCAEAVLALCTLLSAVLGTPGAILQFAVCLVSASVLTGARRPVQIVEAAICLVCAFAAAAGLATLCGGKLIILAPLGTLALLLLVRRRRSPAAPRRARTSP